MLLKQIAKFERVINFMTSKNATNVDLLDKVRSTINECAGETGPQRSWLNKAKSNVDRLREEIVYFNNRLEEQRSFLQLLESLDAYEKVSYDEKVALQPNSKLVRARRNNQPTETIMAELNETLDELKELYVERRKQRQIDIAEEHRLERQRRIESPDFQAEVADNLAMTMTSLTTRQKSRARQLRSDKLAKSRRDKAIRATMKGNEQGGTSKKKDKAA